MEIVQFDAVRDGIINQMRRQTLIPIIGSGFSKGCPSLNGVVPSGQELIKKIFESILAYEPSFPEQDKEKLLSSTLPQIMNFYHKIVPKKEKLTLYRDVFSHVELNNRKKDFLRINWPYIYTLNIDDSIERNSKYNYVIYSNRIVNDNVFDEENCLIKLHGDVFEILTYADSGSEIFDQRQYTISLSKNTTLLSRLKHDFQFNNILFLGCSLDDEEDLRNVFLSTSQGVNERYFCTAHNPSLFESINLEQYGITKCIVFSDYDEIYKLFCDCFSESQKIPLNSIESFSINSIARLKGVFAENKQYLFFGKTLIDKNRLTVPFFFVNRLAPKTIKEMLSNTIHFIIGPGCSGKTYLAADIAMNITDRKVYYFSTQYGLNDASLDYLLGLKNVLIIADSNVLTIEQIEKLLKVENELEKKHNTFMIIENKNNRDLYGKLSFLEKKKILSKPIGQYITTISNKLKKEVVHQINDKLATMALGVFSENRSLADNIIENSKNLMIRNRFSSIKANCSNSRETASLIALASEYKVYSSRVTELDLVKEFQLIVRKCSPLIEYESTWSFEISKSNNSPSKYVINADYWLNNQLDTIAKTSDGERLIIEGYKYIVEKLIARYGFPDLDFTTNNAAYKPYIFFDNINQIFKSKGIVFIRKIYEELNILLSSDPHFLHQRAKCYVRSAKFERNNAKEFLKLAFRLSTEAYSIFYKRNETANNERLEISISHTQYTRILALCHLAKVEQYNNLETNENALNLLYESWSVNFDYDKALKDSTFNYDDAVGKLINRLSRDNSLSPDYRKKAQSLLALIINN